MTTKLRKRHTQEQAMSSCSLEVIARGLVTAIWYSVGCMSICTLGCSIDSIGTKFEDRQLGEISELKNGAGALHASLPVKPAGWSIGIGDKFKNHDLLERQVTINIRNTGQMPLIHHLHIAPYDYTRFEELKIEPGNQVTAFKGTMGTFWRNLSTLSLYALSGSKMSFMIIVEFGDDVSTCNPIEIEAHYRDSF